MCLTTGHRVSVQVAVDWMRTLLISGFCCSLYLRLKIKGGMRKGKMRAGIRPRKAMH